MKIASLFISLIIIFHTQVFAQEFICKSKYEERMQKLEKTYQLRRFSYISAYALILVGGMATAPIGSTVVLISGAIAGGILEGRHSFNAYDLDEQVQRAYELQSAMHISYSDMEAEFIKKRTELIQKAHEDFGNSVIEGIPYQLLIDHSPKLTILPKEYFSNKEIADIESKIYHIIYNYMPEPKNVITETLDYLKSTKRITQNTTYDELRQILIDNQALFCDLKKAQKLNRAIKKIFPKRKNVITTMIP